MITRRSRALVALITTLAILEARASPRSDDTFPRDFAFGVATASYQIEGGWNANGKGENIWDAFTHGDAKRTRDHRNGDVADDSYDLYRRDVEMLRELGVDFYRFSISWSRLLPTGHAGRPNSDGVRYYNALIDLLLKNLIQPVVTMFHWDLPQPLQDVGGWPNPLMADYFVDYADFLFATFGDRVKTWITFNEPKQTCLYGYGFGELAPGINATGFGEYLCGHTLLLAHARAYELYNVRYRKNQKGFIGLTIDCPWFEPATPADKQAAEETRQFYIGWYGHPVFSKSGDYPEVMRHAIANASAKQGLPRSRLPVFTPRQLALVHGSADFFGLNHYTTRLVASTRAQHPRPSFDDDLGYHIYQDPSWPSTNSSWLKVVPWGFGKMTRWVRAQYGGMAVLVTENGVSTVRGLRDAARVRYTREYLRSLLAAVRDGCPVIGYTHWSLMDNFEWDKGFSERFGLYEVDYDSANRTRTPRDSATFYREVIRTHRLDHSYAFDDQHSSLYETPDHSDNLQENVIEDIDLSVTIV